MPLQTSNESPSAIVESMKATSSPSKPTFLVVYASHVGGKSWCGDCVHAEPLVEKKFKNSEDIVRVAYAGQRDEWRKTDNPWRQGPLSVSKLPTLYKATGDQNLEALVEGDVYDQKKLDAFVGR